MKTITVIIVLLGILLCGSALSGSAFAAPEEIMLSTYYPAPFGEYEELRAKRAAVGDNYSDPARYSWSPGATNLVNANIDLIVEDRLGIGVPPGVPVANQLNVGSKLEVYSAASTLANLKGDITYAGILIGTNYAAASYTPGVFWHTNNDNNIKPKAGIYLKEDVNKTYMCFGTSNNFLNGITNDAMIIDPAGNVGIGSTAPGSKLVVYDGGESVNQALFKGALANAGILISTDYTIGAYTPGIFWQTTNNNAGLPKAGIYLKEDANKSYMYFGTSNNHAAGINNDAMVIDPTGNVGIGTTAPSTNPNCLLHVKGTGVSSTGYTINGYIKAEGGLILQIVDQITETNTAWPEGAMWLNKDISP